MNLLSSLDDGVVVYLNSFVHRSWTADHLATTMANNDFLKGGVLMTAFWWAWFREPGVASESGQNSSRDTLLYTLLICIPAVLIVRMMAWFLPYRARPLQNPELHLKFAYTLAPESFAGWSSFPSDHAVLFYALATGFYFVSRRMGWLMYCFVTLFIALPRVYLGIHYPSDLLVGALLGVAAASTVRIASLRGKVNRPAERLLNYSPGLFYASLFQLSYQTAALYDPVRHMALYALQLARLFGSHF